MISALYKAIILKNQGPWGSGPSNNGGGGNNNGGNGGGNEPNNPWGQRGPGGGNRGPNDQPDLDAVLRQAQDRFKNVFGNNRGGNDMNQSKGVGILIALILAIWLASGFYRVEPQEDAVIMTFGKWTDTRVDPGLGYTLPWPIQQVMKVDVDFDRRVEIGFRDASGGRSSTAGDKSDESLMLTGDENIIDIDFVVLWRIGSAKEYLFQIRDPETTVRKVAESAMREIIGRTPIQKALTEARGSIEVDTKALMQKILDEYKSGIIINSVQLLKVDPPSAVVDAFNDVQRARADRERLKNEAQTYSNDIVPRARGDAQKLLQDAEAYKAAVTSKAKGESDRFMSVYKAYAESKDVTQKRMYIETMQQIMQTNRKIIMGDGKGQGVLPYLPLDALKPAAPAKPQ